MSALDALALKFSPQNSPNQSQFPSHQHDDDADTASQRSISLSSPTHSARNSLSLVEPKGSSQFSDDDDAASAKSISLASPVSSPRVSQALPAASPPAISQDGGKSVSGRSSFLSSSTIPTSSPSTTSLTSLSRTVETSPSPPSSKRGSKPYTLETDFGSETGGASTRGRQTREDSATSAERTPVTYPPTPSRESRSDAASITSFSSGTKVRPESLVVPLSKDSLVLGVALVDFNHLVGPRIEFSQGKIFDDDDVAKILPFLALPDGAHLNAEDYSYFHLVPSSPNPTTIFGISCNMQIASDTLLVKNDDVTRSTVQKSVVVLASKPVFGPTRDKLRVVTHALFNQRDFRETDILSDFSRSLEGSLRTQLTESGLYMGTSVRELVHTFRQRTLVLLKALMLQKKIMFYGHPVERLCTYQYSLISLIPGLLQTLDDCGSPPLATRAATLSRSTSLKTSDRNSMMAYIGLPLDVFGKDAFLQPYLPLQQLDMIKDTPSWMCGSTNSIVTQQKEVDILVNIETGFVEFRNPALERSAGLTAADRKWMDDIVKDVNDGWNDENPTRPLNMQFKGSDDYLRTKFEEYVSAALASVRYRDFLAKGEGNGMIGGGSGGDAHSTEDFNPHWISEFKKTNAYEVWERTTDPMLFDIVEPRHPCNEKVSVVTDIGLRLQEGIQDLKLEEQLAPAREAVARTLSAGSTNFWKGVEGVKGRWAAQRTRSSSIVSVNSVSGSSVASTPIEISRSEAELKDKPVPHPITTDLPLKVAQDTPRPISVTAMETKAALGAWGAGIGSFLSAKAAKFASPRAMAQPVFPAADEPPPPPPHDKASSLQPPPSNGRLPSPPRAPSLASSPKADAAPPIDELQPKDLDNVNSKLSETAP